MTKKGKKKKKRTKAQKIKTVKSILNAIGSWGRNVVDYELGEEKSRKKR